MLGVPLAMVGRHRARTDGATQPVSVAPEHNADFVERLTEAVQACSAPVRIEDTRSHPLVRTVALIGGVRVLSALAVPIIGDRGDMIGALCAMDGVPRWWSDRDVASLQHGALVLGALMSLTTEAVERDTPHSPTRQTHAASAVKPLTQSAPIASEQLLAALHDGLLLLGNDWTVRWSNPVLSEMLGVPLEPTPSVDVRQTLAAHLDATVIAAWQRAIDAAAPSEYAWHHQPSDRWFDGRAWPTPDGLAIAVRDVTSARRAAIRHAEQVNTERASQSLTAVGQLAGGIAHDFNNLLTVIRANAELLRTAPLADDATTELSEIQRAADRATVVTQQLLSVGQQQALDPQVVSLQSVLGRLEPTLRALLPHTIRMETSLCLSGDTVFVDPAQLEYVIVQLVRNARDAMPDGGTLHLATHVRALSAPRKARPSDVPAGRWVTLLVRDTGHGVAPELMDRIFEPFFTTRDIGAGVGLGLSSAYGLIAQSGGRCTVESEPGHGASFVVWLPQHTLA